MAVIGPGPGSGPGPVSGPGAGPGGPAPIVTSPAQRLDAIDEQVWLQLGALAESMGEFDRAMASYESALRHNYHSINALNLIAELYRSRDNFPKAAEYFQRILAIDNASGEVWGSLGHCYLMMDELQKAYNAYQNALHHLPNPKDCKLWFGIGILYERYHSVEHAEEAFSAVMRMDPKYEKANEIYFRLGIIYKGQQKYAQSLECFRYILHTPPRPLTEADIWFQIGHVHEQQKEYTSAKEAYERVLTENPNHAKVLQQLGWLYHQQNAPFMNQDLAIKFLTRSIESDNTDAQSWYLMGRCYMAQQKFNKAYEAYQQAVYRDSRNPTFWCSIGLLYFQINQYRDALDAYSKAIRINPNISEVWYDLGTLYESCNNQVSDAIDAYQRASDLDPENPHIKQRLAYLRQNGGGQPGVPPPEEMSPNAYPSSALGGGQHAYGQRITVAPQGPPTGMQGYTGRQQALPAPLSATMNGEHQQSGRDLPLPMAGGGNAPGSGNLHSNGGRASGSPGSFMNEDRPHIPNINSGGPRPPTPAAPMPQMISGDRTHGGAPPPPLGGHGQSRTPRGRPQSPTGEGPYGRGSSPGMPNPNHGHGHEPHYPQHAFGHGPPQPQMQHEGPPQPPFERQDESLRMKQEQARYQHHRHRSSDVGMMGVGDEDRGPKAQVADPQRHHGSDPHSLPRSPPRDDRRLPANPHGQFQHQPHAPTQPQPSQQQQQQQQQQTPTPHNSDGQWMPPFGHGRQPSDDKTIDAGNRAPIQHPNADRRPGIARNKSGPDSYQQRGHEGGHPGADSDREDPRPMMNHGGSFPHPCNTENSSSDQGSRGPHQHEHGHMAGQGHSVRSAYDVPSVGDRDRPSSGWQDARPNTYRSEEQDQDEIAASLVSLSGEGSRGNASRAHDDDYDMEEAEPAPMSGSRQGLPPSEPTPQLQESVQHSQHQHSLHQPPVSYQEDPQRGAKDQDPSHPSATSSQRSLSSRPVEERSSRQGTPERGLESRPRPPTPQHPSSAALAADGMTASKSDAASATRAPFVERQLEDRVESVKEGSPADASRGAETAAEFTAAPVSMAPVAPPLASGPGPAAASGQAPMSSAKDQTADDDTEMEEGEVREDEDDADEDEVMSSGAVAPLHDAQKE